jgi:fumarylacetoacetate (FAA) hydrolase
MKLVSFTTAKDEERLGLVVNDAIVDLANAAAKLSISLPFTMAEFLNGEKRLMDRAHSVHKKLADGVADLFVEKNARLLAPVPHPTSCRDAYAFRQHVATARRNRGLEMIPEFDQFPVFYFTNHHGIVGPGEVVVESDHLQQLDFELEVAIVIGRGGKNITANEADDYIAGFMVMNDLSARVLQMDEMKLSLGPAKGKDFATAVGPWLVTPDELQGHLVPSSSGNRYDLAMKAFHNGRQVSDGNLSQMNWTFAEIIERAAYGVQLFPGDIIGSGTVGTGCYLELNGTWGIEAKDRGESFTPVWLKAGDSITLEVTGLGQLTNTIAKSAEDRSILAKKRPVRS